MDKVATSNSSKSVTTKIETYLTFFDSIYFVSQGMLHTVWRGNMFVWDFLSEVTKFKFQALNFWDIFDY